MQNKNIQVQGVVLRAVRYGAAHQMLTLFTAELGLLTCSRKGALSLKPKGGRAALTPLAEAEFMLRLSSSEVHSCQEVSAVRWHHQRAPSYQSLEIACGLADAVLRSQPLEAPAPILYRLFVQLLRALPSFVTPAVCLTTFQLKLLQHEGLLSSVMQCQVCEAKQQPLKLLRGEVYCLAHAPAYSLSFSTEDITFLSWLLTVRKIAVLQEASATVAFTDKIARLFTQIYP